MRLTSSVRQPVSRASAARRPSRCTFHRWTSLTGARRQTARGRGCRSQLTRCDELLHNLEPVAEESRREEVAAYVLLAALRHLGRLIRVLEEVHDAIGARVVVGRVDEESPLAVAQLQRDAADGTGHHRRTLPERFGDSEPEPLFE